MPFTVPGIGYAGLGQQTAAAQMTYRKAMGGSATRRKSTGARKRKHGTPWGRATRADRVVSGSRRRTRAAREMARRTRRIRSKPARLVKGSAAAKRYMAKIRKMRKR